jgi:DNA replication and repair protein RecF
MLAIPGPLPAAVFKKISLRGFRNHAEAAFTFAPGRTVIVGPNGSGKTNILEAMSLMSPGRGLRRATAADMTSIGADGFTVFASLESDGGELGIGTAASPGSGARRVRIDGENASGSEALLDHLRLLWITTEMDRLFSESPETRRRFMDRFILSIEPVHARRMSDYDRCVRMRNSVLQEGGSESMLSSMDREFARLAVEVDASRSSAVRLLARTLENQPETGFPKPALSYLKGMDEAGSAEEILERLKKRRPAERSAGRTIDGPHRADLGAFYAEKDMEAAMCSTGEQKAMVVSLVIAQAAAAGGMNGTPPIVLVDEAGAHLSPGRRESMFAALDATGSQVVMTGTEETHFDAVRDETEFIRLVG